MEKECMEGAADRQDVIILTKSEMKHCMYHLDVEDFVKKVTLFQSGGEAGRKAGAENTQVSLSERKPLNIL